MHFRQCPRAVHLLKGRNCLLSLELRVLRVLDCEKVKERAQLLVSKMESLDANTIAKTVLFWGGKV